MPPKTQTLQNDIVSALGLNDLPKETRDELIAKIVEVVIKRLLLNIFDRLSEDSAEEFGKLQTSGDADAMEVFLKEKIEDYDNLVQTTVSDFIAEVKGTIETLKSSINA